MIGSVSRSARVAFLRDVVEFDRNTIQPEAIQTGTHYLGLEHLCGDGTILGPVNLTAGDLASAKFTFTPEHVLYGKLRPYLRKVVRPTFPGVCSTDIIPFRPGPDVDRDYLYHWLRTARMVSLAESRSSGANLPRISPAVMGGFEIPLPLLAEQKRIASVLDKADRIARTRDTSIRTLQLLMESLWCQYHSKSKRSKVVLSCLALAEKNTFTNGPFGSDLLSAEFVNSGVPVIYIQDIASGRYIRVSNRFVTTEKAAHISACSVIPGDVLIAKVGDPPGTAAVYPQGGPLAVVTQDVIRLRADPKKTNSQYLVHMLNSRIGRSWLKPIIVEATRNRFSLGAIKRTEVELPDVEIQNEFAEVACRLDLLRRKQHETAVQAAYLCQSIEQNAFPGKFQ